MPGKRPGRLLGPEFNACMDNGVYSYTLQSSLFKKDSRALGSLFLRIFEGSKETWSLRARRIIASTIRLCISSRGLRMLPIMAVTRSATSLKPAQVELVVWSVEPTVSPPFSL